MIQVLSLFAGLLTGVIKDIITQKMKLNAQQHQAMMAKLGVVVKDRRHARRQKGFQFARRTIVLSFMFILIAPVILLFINPDMVFNVPIPSNGEGFSFLFGLFSVGGDSIRYIQVTGYVYIYTVLELMAPIVGFYFGSSGTK